MSLAEDLLNSLPEDQTAVTSVDPTTEPHIVINADKTVTVPDELKRILVQHDHNIVAVTFDCPRYWDGHDLSQMSLRIVFQRSDDHKEPHPVENLRIDESDTNMIHFDWTISGNTTLTSGNVKITVCAKLTNAEGVSEREWHTIPNQDLFVNEGMDCSGDEIVERNPDVIEYILAELDDLKNATPANPSTPNPDSGQNLNPVAKTEGMTQPVGADSDGRLWTTPAGGDAYFELTAGGAPAARGEPINVVVGSIWNSTHGVNEYFDTGYHSSAKWNPDIASKIQNAPSDTYYNSYGWIHSNPYRGKVYFRLVCKGEYGNTTAYRPCIVVSDTNELQSATALTCLDGTLHRSVASLTEGATTYYVHIWEYTIPDGRNGWVLMTPDDSVYIKTEDVLPYQGVFFVNPLDDPLQSLEGNMVGGGGAVQIKGEYSYGFYSNMLQDETFKDLFKEHFYALAADIGLMQTCGKSWYAAGDSNHDYSGGDGQTTNGWLTDVNKYLGFGRIVNAGYAGSTWSGTTGGGGIKRITDLIAAGTAYDVVTLAWGTNAEESGTIDDEASNADGATMVSAMKWGIPALRAAYPKTAIGVVIPPPKGVEGEIDSVADLMIEVCDVLHVPYVDMRRYVALGDLGSDAVHLASGGARKYGAALGSFVRDICPYGEPL